MTNPNKPSPAGLIRTDFTGAVLLTEFIMLPSGGNVRGLLGTISVYSAKEAMGFDVNDRDSNWCVRVTGPTAAITVPGCKVYLIMSLPDLHHTNSDYWKVT